MRSLVDLGLDAGHRGGAVEQVIARDLARRFAGGDLLGVDGDGGLAALGRHGLHLGRLGLLAAALGLDEAVAEPGLFLGRQRRGQVGLLLVVGAAAVEVGLGEEICLVGALGVA
jgi:hypothetical protein